MPPPTGGQRDAAITCTVPGELAQAHGMRKREKERESKWREQQRDGAVRSWGHCRAVML